MRAAFIKNLIELARRDTKIFLLVGDVGYLLVEPFAKEFPGRFINIGIAEQNMMGIGAGLALSGKTVFLYSLANFTTVRCIEQIRNDVCYHKANVKIVTSGCGLIYGALGPTHHLTEDIALMRALPNMTVISPGDPFEAACATQAAALFQGPCYLRLGRTGDAQVHEELPDFKIGRAIKLRDGHNITLIATGGILPNVYHAAGKLARQGVEARVISMPTVKPLDREAVRDAARETGAIVTIEEHSIMGGLGSAVAEILAEESNSSARFMRMGIPDEFCSMVGNQDYLRNIYSLSVDGIVSSVKNFLENKKR